MRVLSPRSSSSSLYFLCVSVRVAGMDGRSLQTFLEGMDRNQVLELLNQGGLPFGNLAGLTGSASPSRPSTGSRSRPETAGVSQSHDSVSQSGSGRRASGTSRGEQPPQPR